MFLTKKNHSAANGLISVIIAVALTTAFGCGGGKKTAMLETPESQVAKTPPKPKPVVTAPVQEPEVEVVKPAPLNLANVYFDYDKFDLSVQTREILAQHARALKERKDATVIIEGHCDERGTIEYNLALGDKRAKAVKDYLVSLGIDRARLTTISYGKEKPLDYGHNESSWSKNRRAQFIIKAMMGTVDKT